METSYKRGKLNFDKDVLSGDRGEADMVEFFKSLGFKFIEQTIGNDPRWDLVMEYNGLKYTIEIKTDSRFTKEEDRGNIAIEFECRGKPSGIDVTSAYLFVTYFPILNEVWIMRTHELKSLIEKKNPYKTKESGDKNSSTRLHLMNRNSVRSNFSVYEWPIK